MPETEPEGILPPGEGREMPLTSPSGWTPTSVRSSSARHVSRLRLLPLRLGGELIVLSCRSVRVSLPAMLGHRPLRGFPLAWDLRLSYYLSAPVGQAPDASGPCRESGRVPLHVRSPYVPVTACAIPAGSIGWRRLSTSSEHMNRPRLK